MKVLDSYTVLVWIQSLLLIICFLNTNDVNLYGTADGPILNYRQIQHSPQNMVCIVLFILHLMSVYFLAIVSAMSLFHFSSKFILSGNGRCLFTNAGHLLGVYQPLIHQYQLILFPPHFIQNIINASMYS